MLNKPLEAKPLREMSIEEKKEQFPYGVCGLGVGAQAILLPGKTAGSIAQPGQVQLQISVLNLLPPCCGPDCQMWIDGSGPLEFDQSGDGWCCIRHLARLRDIAEAAKPALGENGEFRRQREPRTVRQELKENGGGSKK